MPISYPPVFSVATDREDVVTKPFHGWPVLAALRPDENGDWVVATGATMEDAAVAAIVEVPDVMTMRLSANQEIVYSPMHELGLANEMLFLDRGNFRTTPPANGIIQVLGWIIDENHICLNIHLPNSIEIHRGEWREDAVYSLFDVVSLDNSEYRYIHPTPSAAKVTSDSTYWQIQKIGRSAQVRTATTVAYLQDWRNESSGYDSGFIMTDGSVRLCGYSADGRAGDSGNVYHPQLLAIDTKQPPQSPFVQILILFQGGYLRTQNGEAYSSGVSLNGSLGHGDTLTYRYAKRVEFFVENGLSVRDIIGLSNYYLSETFVVFICDSATEQGIVYAVGINTYGNLGDGTTISRSIPVRCGTIANVVQISIGNYSVLALTSNGDLYGWGYGGRGGLGLGSLINNNPTPVKVLANVKQVWSSVGSYYNGTNWYVREHSLALMQDGKVMGCGGNNYNGLGLNLAGGENISSWTPIVGEFPEIVDLISSGGHFPVAYLRDINGLMYAAGYSTNGATGQGDTVARKIFSPILGMPPIVKMRTGGGQHGANYCYAQDINGDLWSWGYNGYGNCAAANGFNTLLAPQKVKGIPVGCQVIDFVTSSIYQNRACHVKVLLNDGRVLVAGGELADHKYGATGLYPDDLRYTDAFCPVQF